MSENDTEKEVGAVEDDGSNVQSGGPTGKIMPVDMDVWRQARNLITDKGIRVEELAAACVQDPVIVLELLRVANALYFSGGRAPITSVKNAIVRLGSEVVVEHLEELKSRPPIQSEEVKKWFAFHRNRCRRVAITATILSQVAARQLSDDCQTAALFASIGEMLAAFHYGDEYVELANNEDGRVRINYRLANDLHFDVEQMGLKYLRKHGLPEVLVFALDREAKARNPERAITRPICLGAAELVDAFDNNRWEKLAPGKTLPSKSNLRLLRIDDNQYLKVYERVAEYLFAIKLAEERAKPAPEPEPEPAVIEVDAEADALAADIESLLKSTPKDDPASEAPAAAKPAAPAKAAAPAATSARLGKPAPPTPAAKAPAPPAHPPNSRRAKAVAGTSAATKKTAAPASTPATEKKVSSKKNTEIHSVKYSMVDPEDQFSLSTNAKGERPARANTPTKVEPPQLRTEKGTAIVTSITRMFDDASSSEELLSTLLERLTKEGPFEKSALIVISKDRKNAIVVAARGPNIGNGQKIEIDDPLSPLAQCFTKVQSFGNKPNESSPFGSKAFALAPIQADHETPVALYADCGVEGSLTFEARRIFRTVVDILNQRLPSIPGGIPVEL